MFIRVSAHAVRKLLSVYVLSYFPFGFEGRIWDLGVSVPDQCLSLYFQMILIFKNTCQIHLNYEALCSF